MVYGVMSNNRVELLNRITDATVHKSPKTYGQPSLVRLVNSISRRVTTYVHNHLCYCTCEDCVTGHCLLNQQVNKYRTELL
jgi:hypothetical protein